MQASKETLGVKKSLTQSDLLLDSFLLNYTYTLAQWHSNEREWREWKRLEAKYGKNERDRVRVRALKSSSHVILILCFHFPTENVYYIIIIILCYCVAFCPHSLARTYQSTVFLLQCVVLSSYCLVSKNTITALEHSTIIITCNSCFSITMNRLKICDFHYFIITPSSISSIKKLSPSMHLQY